LGAHPPLEGEGRRAAQLRAGWGETADVVTLFRQSPLPTRLGVGQPHAAAAAGPGEVVVGLEPDSADAVEREHVVHLLRVARDADGADDLALSVADQLAAALVEDLVAAGIVEVVHEGRLFDPACLDEL